MLYLVWSRLKPVSLSRVDCSQKQRRNGRNYTEGFERECFCVVIRPLLSSEGRWCQNEQRERDNSWEIFRSRTTISRADNECMKRIQAQPDQTIPPQRNKRKKLFGWIIKTELSFWWEEEKQKQTEREKNFDEEWIFSFSCFFFVFFSTIL